MKLTDEEKHELISAIANDIYQRSTWLQVMSLVQNQCTTQATKVVENATDEELQEFLDTLKNTETTTEKTSAAA
ncbi:hypothetical protein OAU81_00345 [bacterium]|nr:hypothetical protein [bacterium]